MLRIFWYLLFILAPLALCQQNSHKAASQNATEQPAANKPSRRIELNLLGETDTAAGDPFDLIAFEQATASVEELRKAYPWQLPPVAPDPVTIVIFGGGGDLSHRKLLPALYNLHLDAVLPPQAARNPEFYQKQNLPVPSLRVVKEEDDGLVVSGMKMLATGAVFANEIWIGNLLPLAPTQLAGDRQSDDAPVDDQEIAGCHCRRSTIEGAAFWTIDGWRVEDVLIGPACAGLGFAEAMRYITCFDATFE